jgi:putative ABC transport system substrate-binding protein
MITRRQVSIALLSNALIPLRSIAQQTDKVRRIGLLLGYSATDQEAQARVAAFRNALSALGWNEGRNVSLEFRWTEGDAQRATVLAKELVALQPDLLLAATTPATAALQRETRTVPIVFTIVSDPVGSGFVKALSRPGGNVTGFINLESSLMEKWVQLLKEVAPRVTRVAVMFNPATAPYAEYYLQPLIAAAPKLGVKTSAATVRSEAEIESVIAALAKEPNAGLVIMTDSFMAVHRKAVIAMAARFKLPTVYFAEYAVADGGLLGYGIDNVDIFRRAASYADRILRGANAGDLPVEQPAKFILAVNVKAAKELGLSVPQSILLRADKVIE